MPSVNQLLNEAVKHRKRADKIYKHITIDLAREIGRAKTPQELVDILREVNREAKEMIDELKLFVQYWSQAEELAKTLPKQHVMHIDISFIEPYIKGVDNVIQSALAKAYQILHGITEFTPETYREYVVEIEPGYQAMFQLMSKGYSFPPYARLVSHLIPGWNHPNVIKWIYRTQIKPLVELYMAAERGDVGWLETNLGYVKEALKKAYTRDAYSVALLSRAENLPSLEKYRLLAEYLKAIREVKDAEKAARLLNKIPDLYEAARRGYMGSPLIHHAECGYVATAQELRTCLLKALQDLINAWTYGGKISLEEAAKGINKLKEKIAKEYPSLASRYNSYLELIQFYKELKNNPDMKALELLLRVSRKYPVITQAIDEIANLYYRAKAFTANTPEELVKKLEAAHLIPSSYAEALLKHPHVLHHIYRDMLRQLEKLIYYGDVKRFLDNHSVSLLAQLSSLRSPSDVTYELVTKLGEYGLPRWLGLLGPLRAWLMEIWYRLRLQTPNHEKEIFDKIRNVVYKYRYDIPRMVAELRKIYNEWKRIARKERVYA